MINPVIPITRSIYFKSAVQGSGEFDTNVSIEKMLSDNTVADLNSNLAQTVRQTLLKMPEDVLKTFDACHYKIMLIPGKRPMDSHLMEGAVFHRGAYRIRDHIDINGKTIPLTQERLEGALVHGIGHSYDYLFLRTPNDLGKSFQISLLKDYKKAFEKDLPAIRQLAKQNPFFNIFIPENITYVFRDLETHQRFLQGDLKTRKNITGEIPLLKKKNPLKREEFRVAYANVLNDSVALVFEALVLNERPSNQQVLAAFKHQADYLGKLMNGQYEKVEDGYYQGMVVNPNPHDQWQLNDLTLAYREAFSK